MATRTSRRRAETARSGPRESDTGDAPALAPELMARVRQIQIRTHRLVSQALSGAYRSTFRGTGIEFEEVRPYQPGDDVRAIDWNVTARTGEAFIKTYREERQLTLQFLVDTSASMDFGSVRVSKRELAAEFCALLAFVAVGEKDQVGLCLFDDEPGLTLPARQGQSHVLRVVREVMAARPAPLGDRRDGGRGGGGGALSTVLESQARLLRRRSLVFVVSDFLDPDVEGWTEALGRLSAKHDVVAVRVVDPFEEALPEAGIVLLSELEGGQEREVDTRSPKVRAAWSAAAQARREQLQRALSKARADLIELNTSTDVADPVVRFFRRRGGRRG